MVYLVPRYPSSLTKISSAGLNVSSNIVSIGTGFGSNSPVLKQKPTTKSLSDIDPFQNGDDGPPPDTVVVIPPIKYGLFEGPPVS